MSQQGPGGGEEPRFDTDTTRRIVALAARLQSEDLDTLTPRQLKEIAREAGIEPRYIDASIEALSRQRQPLARASRAWLDRAGSWLSERLRAASGKPENQPFLNAAALGAIAGILAPLSFIPIPIRILTWVTLGLALAVNDAFARGFRRGLLSQVIGQGMLILLLALFGYVNSPEGGAAGILGIILFPAALLGGALGAIGHALEPKEAQQPALPDRQQLLQQFYQLRDALAAGAEHWTYLAVDVAGSTALKEGADHLAVEFTFGEFSRYVTETVMRQGGQLHSTAGDGALCAFRDASSAFTAAQALQRGMADFNRSRNRLRGPVLIRAGIHSGAIRLPDGDPGRVQFSHVLDVASHLQRAAPVGGIALSEEAVRQAGIAAGLVPIPEPVDGHRVYAWGGGVTSDG